MIRSIYLISGYVELGAHWVHGMEGNRVYEWAKQQDPPVVDVEFNTIQTGLFLMIDDI